MHGVATATGWHGFATATSLRREERPERVGAHREAGTPRGDEGTEQPLLLEVVQEEERAFVDVAHNVRLANHTWL